jgi:Ca2+-binding RTX toxin-like protein
VAGPFITVDNVTVGEQDAFAVFTVRLSAASADTVTVGYSQSNGTAANGSDYVAQGSQTLTFAPGELVKTIQVSLLNNALVEAPESFFLNLFSATNAEIETPFARATIIDNDAPAGTPLVSVSDLVVDEQAGTVSFAVTLDRPSAGVVSMNYATVNGTAVAGTDYVATSGSLVFAAGETAKTVTVSLNNNAAAELDESFSLQLSALVGATTLDPIGTAVIAANDAPAVATPFISVENVTVGEQDTYATFVVRLSAPSADTVTVGYSQSNATATNGNDYQALGGQTLTFAPGETVKTVQINLLNDAAVEATESFFFNLFSSTNAQIATAIARATIIDNDAPAGTPRVSVGDAVVDEQAGTVSFVVMLDRPSTGVVSMNYGTVNGSAASGSDYVAASGSLSFAPGETAKTVTITITNDAAAELDENFSLQLSALAGATALDPLGTAVIAANDAPAAASPLITVENVTVGEQDIHATFVVRLSAPSTQTVTVGYSQSNGTAANGSDYQAMGSQTLTFAPGETVKTVQVNLLDGGAPEAAESFFFNLFSATNAAIGTTFARATIIDNDAPPGTPVVSVSDLVVDEQSGTVSFAITLDRPSTGVVSMNYGTVNGTAVAGADYVATSGSISFAPGETAKTVTVSLVNNAAAELDESFSLQLSALVGATTLDPTGTAVIAANDAPAAATPFITVENVTVGEQDTYATFVVRLSAPSTQTVTVGYSQSSATAANGSDFQALGGQTLTFAPGETVKAVQVNLLDGNAPEAAESFFFNLFGATNAQIETSFARATIIDNDATAGTPVVSVSDVVVDEQAGTVSFAVTLDRPSTGVVSMNYGTVNGSATAGTDYVATSGSLSFAAGETAKTVTVSLVNNAAAELDESFSLQLSALVGATTLDPSGTAVIAANDAPAVASPLITVENVTVGENETHATFVVRLSAPSTQTVTVGYSQSNGTAANGSDYQAMGSQTLTFAPGETVKSIQVNLLDGAAAEGAETFFLNLFSATNADIGTTFARATIIDNDAPAGTPLVSVSDLVVDEQAGTVTFAVTLDRPSTGVVSMNYGTVDGTAVAGTDYVAASGTLSFAPGETVKTVSVSLVNNALAELDESFSLQLSALTGATTLDPLGTAVIGANDSPAAATPFITVDDVTVGEQDTYATFVVRLSAPSTQTVTVGYSQSNATSTNGSDYLALGGQTLTFAPGETVKSVQVNILDGAVAEGTDNFFFNLFSATNAQIETPYARATIIDNDAPAGTPAVSVGSIVADEKDGLISVTFVLDKPATGNVTVNYALRGVTAGETTDFASVPTQNVAFSPGETAKTIVISLVDDAVSEMAELFDVAITGATGATVGTANGHVIIAGNDTANAALPSISVAVAAAAENDTYVDFVVALSAPSASTVTVGYSQSNASAANGSDYQALGSQTLTFAPGETVKIVRIALLDNAVAEGSETFNLNLFGAVNATIGNTAATATIIDDDSPVPGVVNIPGTPGPDILNGTRFADSLTGLAGNDVLNGGGDNDTMAGGLGNDFYIVEQAGDVVVEAAGAGRDRVASYLASYTLTANVEDLVLASGAQNGTGNSRPNVIQGNSLDNVLNGGANADTMIGELGNDTYTVDNVGDVVTENPGGGIDTVRSSISHTLGANLENLTLIGAGANNGTGNGAANVIIGNAANNVLDGAGGTDTVSYAGTAGAVTVDLSNAAAQNTVSAGIDTLANFENATGTAFNDTLTGNAGNNVLDGGAGADAMSAGLGDDTYVVDNAGDVVTESAAGGTDTVQSSIDYTLGAEIENLTLLGGALNGTGNALANTITGNGAANVLTGGGGADTLNGAAGNDTLVGGGGADTLVGGAGTDTLNGGAGADMLTGNAGPDTFLFNSIGGVDNATDFVSGVDKFSFSQAGIEVGDGDTAVEGAVTVAGPGGFAATAELVVVTGNIAGAITAASAAAAIGSATSAYGVGDTVLFAVDNGVQSTVFLFQSSGADALVSAGELTELFTATGTPATVLADYVFTA